MDERQAAIDNNLGLCRAVLAARGLTFEIGEAVASTLERPPTYYPNVVTRRPDWAPGDLAAALDRRAAAEGWDGWALKDSFAALDADRLGFEPVLRAHWLFAEAGALRLGPVPGLRFDVVRTAAGLAAWLRAWDADPGLGGRVFDAILLDHPDFRFLAAYDGADLVAGCLLNRTGEVLGLSNTFSTVPGAGVWAAALDRAFDLFGPAPVVSYADGDLAAALQDLGLAPVGALQVLLRRTG